MDPTTICPVQISELPSPTNVKNPLQRLIPPRRISTLTVLEVAPDYDPLTVNLPSIAMSPETSSALLVEEGFGYFPIPNCANEFPVLGNYPYNSPAVLLFAKRNVFIAEDTPEPALYPKKTFPFPDKFSPA